MLHHSFEHMDQPGEVLQNLERLLAPAGLILLRIPVSDSFAWKHYGIHWVNLDAPRHFFLHTRRSIDFLTNQSQLCVKAMLHEASTIQFWGSEQYLKDIPLQDPRSYARNRLRPMFSRQQLKEFEQQAKVVARQQESDSVCFLIGRIN
jgi:hypothetical protein